jgi:hypothetical protein
MKTEGHTIEEAITPLNIQDKELVEKLHSHALSLGCTPDISAMGKKPNDWKCEYAIKKKTVLFIVRVTGEQ